MARAPENGTEAATTVIRIRVTPTQKRELETVAEENQTDISGLIREAVNEYVADYREGPSVFRRTVSDTSP